MNSEPKQSTPLNIAPNGLVIYDGSCGACTASIGERKLFFERYGFSVVPLQEEWVSGYARVSEKELLKSIHLVSPDGAVYSGADFFLQVAGQIWWLKPVSWFLSWRPIKSCFAVVYDWVAARRQKISRVCGLEDRARYT